MLFMSATPQQLFLVIERNIITFADSALAAIFHRRARETPRAPRRAQLTDEVDTISTEVAHAGIDVGQGSSGSCSQPHPRDRTCRSRPLHALLTDGVRLQPHPDR